MNIPDGVPCKHPGCLSHLSHPCEGCGRIGGRSSNWPWNGLGSRPIIQDGKIIGHEDIRYLSFEEIRRRYPDAIIHITIKSRMEELGITEQDIAETTLKWPWEI
jgi:hypothetical protein